MLEALPGVQQYRIIHERPALISVEIVATEELTSPAMDQCRDRVAALLPVPAEVAVRRVESIERGTGGKHKVFERRW